MRFAISAVFLVASAFLGAAAAHADDVLLEPGIYQIDPNGYLNASTRPAPEGSVYQHKFEHAIPAARAVVTRDPGRRENRVLFLFDNGYRYDRRSNHLYEACPAYAFPDWNYYSAAEPFCRITNAIGSTSGGTYEAAFEWGTNTFTIRWGDDEKTLGWEPIAPTRKPTEYDVVRCRVAGYCAVEAYGGRSDKYEITHRSDTFKLKTPVAYRDMLYLPQNVSFFSNADRAASHDQLAAGNYVAVISSSPEWLEADRFDQHAAPVRGWINRDDIVDLKWVDQKVTTKQFRFRVAFVAGNDADANDADYLIPAAIEVLDRATGQRVQVIRDFASHDSGGDENALWLIDANFDGATDVVIAGYSGGAGPNSTDNFFLFDPKTQQFVYNKELSEMSQISINENKKTITTSQRNSCCSHSSQTYRYQGGKLIEVENWDESMTADGEEVVTTVGHLRNGKWHYHSTSKPVEQK